MKFEDKIFKLYLNYAQCQMFDLFEVIKSN